LQEAEVGGIFVKVSMDGAPYLRKIDLRIYGGYPELLKALETMFKLTIGKIERKFCFLFRLRFYIAIMFSRLQIIDIVENHR
jgi:hypothetical protein